MEPVMLTGGVVVSAEVLRRVIDIEARGVRFRLDEDGRLVLDPEELLTPNDVAFLRSNLAETKRIVSYEAPEL